MTIIVDESALTVQLTINEPNISALLDYEFVLTSQYSHQEEIMSPVSIIISNDRYTQLEVTFPTGFGDAHKNGIYNYEIRSTNAQFTTHGLVKIICEPGGQLGITNYTSNPDTENRVAEVYYRPTY
jgi:hypothetical protein